LGSGWSSQDPYSCYRVRCSRCGTEGPAECEGSEAGSSWNQRAGGYDESLASAALKSAELAEIEEKKKQLRKDITEKTKALAELGDN